MRQIQSQGQAQCTRCGAKSRGRCESEGSHPRFCICSRVKPLAPRHCGQVRRDQRRSTLTELIPGRPSTLRKGCSNISMAPKKKPLQADTVNQYAKLVRNLRSRHTENSSVMLEARGQHDKSAKMMRNEYAGGHSGCANDDAAAPTARNLMRPSTLELPPENDPSRPGFKIKQLEEGNEMLSAQGRKAFEFCKPPALGGPVAEQEPRMYWEPFSEGPTRTDP